MSATALLLVYIAGHLVGIAPISDFDRCRHIASRGLVISALEGQRDVRAACRKLPIFSWQS